MKSNQKTIIFAIIAAAGFRTDIRFLESGGHAVWSDEVRKAIHEEMDKKIAAAGK